MKRKLDLILRGIPLFLFIFMIGLPAFADQSVEKVRHSFKALDLSRTPSVKELMAAGQLGGQLYPTQEAEKDNNWKKDRQAFGQAIEKWNRHEYKKAVQLFRQFVDQNPESPWAAEATLHIGCDARYNGRYNEAEEMFDSIIERHKDTRYDGAKELVSKAKMRLGELKVVQNNVNKAKDVYKNLKETGPNWRQRTYAAHWLHRIRLQESEKLSMLNCGVQALAAVIEKSGDAAAAQKIMALKPDSLRGYNLLRLRDIAAEYGFSFEARKIKMENIHQIPLPAILQIDARNDKESGHFWVLENVEDKMLTLYDPQNERRFQQSPEELGSQWDGVMMARTSDGATAPGTRLSEMDMGQLFGGCCGAPAGEAGLGPSFLGSGDSCGAGGPGGSGDGSGDGGDGPNGDGGFGGNSGAAGSGDGNSPLGAPVWEVNRKVGDVRKIISCYSNLRNEVTLDCELAL